MPLVLAVLTLITHKLPNGTTVVLAPDPAATRTAIHATFDAGKRHGEAAALAENQRIAARLECFDADVNQERAIFSIETDDATAALRRLSEALTPPISRHYTAPSAVIAIAGRVDEHVLDAIRIPDGPPRSPCGVWKAPALPRSPGEVALAYETAVAPSADWFALNVLADILGQGEQSRLQRALVGAGLATRFGEGMTESPCGPSLLRMRVHLAPGVSADRVLKVIDREIGRLRRELGSEEELKIAHEQELRFAAGQLATPAAIAGAAARSALFYGDAQRVTSDGARMERVTAEDVRRVARTYLTTASRRRASRRD
jgi:predicted Zn-dependent peptidase